MIGALLEIPDFHAAFSSRVDVLVLIGDGHGADDIAMDETAENARATRTAGALERIGCERVRLQRRRRRRRIERLAVKRVMLLGAVAFDDIAARGRTARGDGQQRIDLRLRHAHRRVELVQASWRMR